MKIFRLYVKFVGNVDGSCCGCGCLKFCSFVKIFRLYVKFVGDVDCACCSCCRKNW